MDLSPTRGFHSPERKLAFRRFEELKIAYPDFSDYFESNKADLLLALEEILSDAELTENSEDFSGIGTSFYSQYTSSSVYAVEDILISLIDSPALIKEFSIGEQEPS